MYSDMGAPVHSAPLGGVGFSPDLLRKLSLAAAAVVFGVLIAAPRATHGFRQSPFESASSIPSNQIAELCRQGNPLDAIRLADYELNRDGCSLPQLQQIHVLRAGAFRIMRRDTGAAADYAWAARYASGSGDTADVMPLRALGWDPSSAFTLARKTLQNSNTDLWTLNAACWTLAIYPGGDPALAARSISKAALASRNPAIIDTYAWSLYRSGQVEDAKLQEMRALGEAQAENDSLVSYLRACLLGMRGDPVRAEMDLRTIFRQDVSFVDAWTVADRFGERPRASVTVAD